MLLKPASELVSRPVDWLWPGRLAAGKLTLYDGDPALGKSFVALDLCARLSTGRPFPDGAAASEPDDVLPTAGPPVASPTVARPPVASIVISDEDHAEDTIRPRLLALGADLGRVYIWPRDDADGLPTLPSQLDRLESAIEQTGAGLVVLDPFLALIDPQVHVADDRRVRAALRPLDRLAARRRCAMLLLRHLNKKAGGPSLYRGTGSIAFTAFCRLAWLAGRDPKSPGQFVLAQHKSNIAPPRPSLTYAIVGADATPRLEWLGEASWTAADLMVKPRPQPSRARARWFLAGFLKDGPKTARTIWTASRKHRLAPKTLRAAADQLEIRRHTIGRIGQDQRTYWLLPGQQLPPELRNPELAAVESMLDEMAARWPKRVPLEDEK